MKVIIANPPWIVENKFGVRATSRWPHLRKDKILPYPIWHAYSAAIMEKANIGVMAIDAVDKEMDRDSFIEAVTKFDPDYIFIEISFPSYNYDKLTLKKLKTKTKTKICVFGPYATIDAPLIMRECPEIDFIAYGEYDITLKDLVLSEKKSNVKGIYYREGKNIKKTEPRELIENLDELPLPSRHLYPKKSYQEPLCHEPQYFVVTSRGCPYMCSYCLYPQTITGRKFRVRSIKNIVDEIEFLINKFGAKTINFDDDTFTINKQRIKDLCDEIIKRKVDVKWQCWSSVNIQDVEMYKKMKQSGCEMVKFGVESANFVTQKNISKYLDIDKIKTGFDIAKSQGLKTFGTFMFGLPGETKKSMEDTINLAIKLNPFAVQFSYAVAYPGTKLYEEAKIGGWLVKKENDGMAGMFSPSIIPPGLTEKDLNNIVNKAYKRYYLRPRYILKMLFQTSSINDMKRLFGGFSSLMIRLIKK